MVHFTFQMKMYHGFPFILTIQSVARDFFKYKSAQKKIVKGEDFDTMYTVWCKITLYLSHQQQMVDYPHATVHKKWIQ